MLNKRPLSLVLALVAVAGGAAALSATPPQGRASSTDTVAPHNSVAFIVNKENPQSELEIADLRRILLGEMTR